MYSVLRIVFDLLCFFPFAFVYCPNFVFFHFAKNAEAVMKDDISYMDAPDA